jgi:hypothetical protein
MNQEKKCICFVDGHISLCPLYVPTPPAKETKVEFTLSSEPVGNVWFNGIEYTPVSKPPQEAREETRCNKCILENNGGKCDNKQCENFEPPQQKEPDTISFTAKGENRAIVVRSKNLAGIEKIIFNGKEVWSDKEPETWEKNLRKEFLERFAETEGHIITWYDDTTPDGIVDWFIERSETARTEAKTRGWNEAVMKIVELIDSIVISPCMKQSPASYRNSALMDLRTSLLESLKKKI